jgi:surface polysaccharide O-acyltransferase-like enzyme
LWPPPRASTREEPIGQLQPATSPETPTTLPPAGAPPGHLPLWRSIPTLRGLAICLVVANHAIQASSSLFVNAHPAVAPSAMPAPFVTILLLRAITPVCLVAFFFTSGFMAFRFFTDARSSRVAATQLLRKYFMWSAAMLALQALRRRELDGHEVARALLLGGAQSAYWFLVVIIVLMLTTPIWIRVVKATPWSGLVAAGALQLASCASFYLGLLRETPRSVWEIALLRPLQFLPGFLVGMWISLHAERVAPWLRQRRRALLGLAALAAAATLAEAWALWDVAGYRLQGAQPMFATERGTLIALSFVTIAVFATTEPRSPRLVNWLRYAGSSSLGIMLLMDVCIMLVLAAVRYAAPLVSDGAAAALAQGRMPLEIAAQALWLTPVVFVAGLWGPLRIMERVRTFAGNRVRYLW